MKKVLVAGAAGYPGRYVVNITKLLGWPLWFQTKKLKFRVYTCTHLDKERDAFPDENVYVFQNLRACGIFDDRPDNGCGGGRLRKRGIKGLL